MHTQENFIENYFIWENQHLRDLSLAGIFNSYAYIIIILCQLNSF